MRDDFIKMLSYVADNIPAGIYDNNFFRLDGVFQVIRVFAEGIEKEIDYFEVDKIPNIDTMPDIKGFLENMYLEVEKMIGVEG